MHPVQFIRQNLRDSYTEIRNSVVTAIDAALPEDCEALRA